MALVSYKSLVSLLNGDFFLTMAMASGLSHQVVIHLSTRSPFKQLLSGAMFPFFGKGSLQSSTNTKRVPFFPMKIYWAFEWLGVAGLGEGGVGQWKAAGC